MKTIKRTAATVVLLLVAVGAASAKVTADEAARLKTELTPVGAERAANAGGTIPAWEGGLTRAPSSYKGEGSRYTDPYAQDRPLFTITRANLDEHRDKLSVGQLAMFSRYPTYKMKVYPTRRSAAYPQFVYDATYKNALNAQIGTTGEALLNAITGFPFPVPKNGQEVIWNHKVRYRGVGGSRWNNQAAVTNSGAYTLVRITEDAKFYYNAQGVTPAALNNVLIYFLQIVRSPPRLAGQITLVHETMDQVKEPRRAWQYNPGQRRLRRAPNVGYDNPGTGADGLRTNDQLDGYNGAMDRYTWKLLGKKELYIPYNSYYLHSDKHKYADIIRRGHINPELPRYELHRVWVVESQTKPRKNHQFKRRTFYVEEDAWQISVVDCYDNRDQIWRWQELHSFQAYDKPFMALPALETSYDLQSGRYIAYSMNNEESETVERDFPVESFAPANVSKQTIK